jgi:hypothetical protein
MIRMRSDLALPACPAGEPAVPLPVPGPGPAIANLGLRHRAEVSALRAYARRTGRGVLSV